MENAVKKVRTLNKRNNAIYKERTEQGWIYTVKDRDGNELAKLVFAAPKGNTDRLTNSDLLDIVRDRLAALNRNYGTARSFACEQHVCEALFWSDTKIKSDETEEPTETTEGV